MACQRHQQQLKRKLLTFQNAPQLLAKQSGELAEAQLDYEAKQAILNQETASCNLFLRESYNKVFKANYETLLNILNRTALLYGNALNSNYRSGEDKQTLTAALKAGPAGPGAEDESKERFRC